MGKADGGWQCGLHWGLGRPCGWGPGPGQWSMSMGQRGTVGGGAERRGDAAAAPAAAVWAWPVHKTCVGGGVGLCDRVCSGGAAACGL